MAKRTNKRIKAEKPEKKDEPEKQLEEVEADTTKDIENNDDDEEELISSEEEEEDESQIPPTPQTVTAARPTTPSFQSTGRYQNKQRCLILSSRGITARYRHLLEDLKMLIPHHKKESKLDVGKNYSGGSAGENSYGEWRERVLWCALEVHYTVHMTSCLLDWLIDWLLIDWLIAVYLLYCWFIFLACSLLFLQLNSTQFKFILILILLLFLLIFL